MRFEDNISRLGLLISAPNVWHGTLGGGVQTGIFSSSLCSPLSESEKNVQVRQRRKTFTAALCYLSPPIKMLLWVAGMKGARGANVSQGPCLFPVRVWATPDFGFRGGLWGLSSRCDLLNRQRVTQPAGEPVVRPVTSSLLLFVLECGRAEGLPSPPHFPFSSPSSCFKSRVLQRPIAAGMESLWPRHPFPPFTAIVLPKQGEGAKEVSCTCSSKASTAVVLPLLGSGDLVLLVVVWFLLPTITTTLPTWGPETGGGGRPGDGFCVVIRPRRCAREAR